MKTWISAALAGGIVLTAAAPALALGRFGVRVGTGTSFFVSDDDYPTEPEVAPFAIGAAYVLDLALIAVEIDALWWRNTTTLGDYTAVDDHLAIPIIGKLSLPVIPALLSLNVGLGLEPRFLLAGPKDADNYNDYVMYLPVVAGADFDLQVIQAGVEIRYEHQLTETYDGQGDDRLHQLMFFGGVFF